MALVNKLRRPGSLSREERGELADGYGALLRNLEFARQEAETWKEAATSDLSTLVKEEAAALRDEVERLKEGKEDGDGE